MNKNFLLVATLFIHSVLFNSSKAQTVPTVEMGQGLYEQNGTNSCLYCHGIDGGGGKIAAAAKLNHPKSWKSFKALGGDAAFKKNKDEFMGRLKKATLHLIENGAIVHNTKFKESWFDWSKTGGPFNAQMLGVTAAPSAAWINKYKERGLNRALAAEAAYLYIQKFDSDSVFK